MGVCRVPACPLEAFVHSGKFGHPAGFLSD